MVCFANTASMDRMIFSIVSGFNEEWMTAPFGFFTQAV